MRFKTGHSNSKNQTALAPLQTRSQPKKLPAKGDLRAQLHSSWVETGTAAAVPKDFFDRQVTEAKTHCSIVRTTGKDIAFPASLASKPLSATISLRRRLLVASAFLLFGAALRRRLVGDLDGAWPAAIALCLDLLGCGVQQGTQSLILF